MLSPCPTVASDGVTDTDDTTWVTVSDALCAADPEAAEMVAVPAETAVTSPPAETEATAGSLLVQLTLAPLITPPD